MLDSRDDSGRLLPDHARLTPIGAWIRRSSLDELPELWNVLRGDMSLVGPRPLLLKYRGHYTPRERRRFLVRPGITGLAQVSGRNELSWDERLRLDAWYADHCSFMLDMTIVARTLVQVIRGKGVQVDPRATREDLDVERTRLGRSLSVMELKRDTRG